jgi:hypothetical protein
MRPNSGVQSKSCIKRRGPSEYRRKGKLATSRGTPSAQLQCAERGAISSFWSEVSNVPPERCSVPPAN